MAIVWSQVVQENPIQIPTPSDLTENPNRGGGKVFGFGVSKKSASVVAPYSVIVLVFEMEPRRPIFEKCSNLRDKGKVLMLRFQVRTTSTLIRARVQYQLNLDSYDSAAEPWTTRVYFLLHGRCREWAPINTSPTQCTGFVPGTPASASPPHCHHDGLVMGDGA